MRRRPTSDLLEQIEKGEREHEAGGADGDGSYVIHGSERRAAAVNAGLTAGAVLLKSP
jgi:hypothetical protein